MPPRQRAASTKHSPFTTCCNCSLVRQTHLNCPPSLPHRFRDAATTFTSRPALLIAARQNPHLARQHRPRHQVQSISQHQEARFRLRHADTARNLTIGIALQTSAHRWSSIAIKPVSPERTVVILPTYIAIQCLNFQAATVSEENSR